MLRSTFVGLWGLENKNERIEAKIKDAIENPQNYVLKAQAGGGKGNYFDEEMQQMLLKMAGEKRDGLNAYTLMDNIWPIPVKVKNNLKIKN